ncbi:FtsK/SpoIIIE domain-containing protein [Kitasatospora sp. GP82]|uniref:FtsK/SpoIIIE domain-containing protein n=1 Tax=Kitasatospora sp. GP82 TaxID=3035089 RepID=UPI0024738D19|nr:FtsK/SpoIIIE domain-containing protein [Kitasatospora sp. GP82]MDH6126900.1 hypothetical protein [Kitasatospora sp. GP82]
MSTDIEKPAPPPQDDADQPGETASPADIGRDTDTGATAAEEGEKKPNPAAVWAASQARRTGEGARGLGGWLAHWASTADRSGDEVRRRIVAGQLEAFTERRTELRQALERETKAVVRLEEEAADGGLTQAQRGQLTLRREAARRLEKTLRDMQKVPFRGVQPTEKQIARARSLGRLRRGGALIGAAIAAVMLAVHQPQIGLLGLVACAGVTWWTGAHPLRLTHRPIPAELLLPELDPPGKLDVEEAAGEDPGVVGSAAEDPALVCAETELLTKAMLTVGAISEGVVCLASPDAITRMPGGWIARVNLPRDDAADVETVLPKLGKIAGVLGLDRSRFFMEQVHASQGGSAKQIAVAAFDRDPLTENRTSPLIGATGIDVWNHGIPVAYDAFGQIVHLILKDTSLALAGASRTGKGAALRCIIAGALLDLRVNIRLIDGKTPGQDRWRNLAATFIDETGTKGAQRARHLLEAEVAEMSRRSEILKHHGMEQIDDPKLITELGGLEVIVIDEAQALTGDKKHGTAIKEALSALAARGLAFGIILIVATQVATKGNNGVLPRLVTGNITWKWCMLVTETAESNMALSQGASSAGWDASKLDPSIKGMGILFANGYRRIRSLWIDGPDMLQVIDTITTVRQAAGRLRGQWDDRIEAALKAKDSATPPPSLKQPATQQTTPEPEPGNTGDTDGATAADWEILSLTLQWFGAQPNVLCRQVAQMLPLIDEQTWADITTAAVGDAFRRTGVFRKSVRVGTETPSTGAQLDHIRTTLEHRNPRP